MLASSNILAVSRFFDLGWHTVQALDKALLRQTVQESDWSQIHYLAMDEFALHRGHRYATVIADPISRQVLWGGNGRSRDTAAAFFKQLPAGIAEQIRANCPNAEIVYDLFHVVAKYGREVIDRVRVDQANTLRHDKPARRVIKSSRWQLLRNRKNLDRRQTVQLSECDGLKRLWFYRRTGPVRTTTQSLSARDLAPLPTPAHYQYRGRHQQHHQGHQAPSLRLSGSGVLLPENPGSLPRDAAMNPQISGCFQSRFPMVMRRG